MRLNIQNTEIKLSVKIAFYVILFILIFYIDYSFSQTEETIELEIKIKDYEFGALEFFTKNGYGGSYDGTICEILGPSEYAGRQLIIYHFKTVKLDSLWRDIDSVYYLLMNDDFHKMHHIFSGAIREIKKKTDKNHR